MRKAALGTAIALAACGGGDDAPVCRGGYHVCEGQLRDADGRSLILRGVNLAGSQKMAPYLDTFGPADYARVRADWGFDAIRFVMPWAAIEPSPGVYDDAYLDAVATRMEWAAAAGLGVVIDMHQDVYGEGFGFDGAPRWTCDEAYYAAFVPREPWGINYTDPNVIACFDHLWTDAATRGALVGAWGHVAARLAASPAVIGFDPINEPSWGSYAIATFERDRLQPFYDEVVAAVRAAAPGWVAFLEPASSRNFGLPTSLLPFSYPDVVYAPHLYDAQAEQTGGFDPARAPDLVADGANLRAEADLLGAALWIGEYGGQGADPNIAAYMDAGYDAAAAGLGGSMLWSYDHGGGYALLDADGNEVTPLVDAVVRPYPARVAGTPTAWIYDEAARELRITWLPDSSVAAPTVIIAPARVYPNGVAVECGGCTVEIAGDEVRVGGDAEGTVVIRPAP